MDQEQVEMKECSKCGKPFPNTIKNFYRLKSGKLRAHCIDCHKKKYSSYNLSEEGKVKKRSYNKSYYDKNAEAIYARYQRFIKNNPDYQKNWYQNHKATKVKVPKIKADKKIKVVNEKKLLGLLKEHNGGVEKDGE